MTDEKTYNVDEVKNLSDEERAHVANQVRLGKVKFRGKAVIRKADGTIRYDDPSQKGKYNEADL